MIDGWMLLGRAHRGAGYPVTVAVYAGMRRRPWIAE
jgi:hypothetical protein